MSSQTPAAKRLGVTAKARRVERENGCKAAAGTAKSSEFKNPWTRSR